LHPTQIKLRVSILCGDLLSIIILFNLLYIWNFYLFVLIIFISIFGVLTLFHNVNYFLNIFWDNLKNVNEVYEEEIEKEPIPLVKHFEFVVGSKSNHSRHIGNISMTTKKVEKQLFQS